LGLWKSRFCRGHGPGRAARTARRKVCRGGAVLGRGWAAQVDACGLQPVEGGPGSHVVFDPAGAPLAIVYDTCG
jgi:hypothetical protein